MRRTRHRACLLPLAFGLIAALSARATATAQTALNPGATGTPLPAETGSAPAPAAPANIAGQFDYFLLDMPWGAVFCSSIQDVSAQCRPHPGFVVHGLWPQNNNGTWPQFCSAAPPPGDLSRNLDITPDLALLDHEWKKHGTCSGLAPNQFFAAEHQAFAQVKIPLALIELNASRTFTPQYALNMFYIENPGLPKGSVSLSCRENHAIAIDVCFNKSLQPVRCTGLKSCNALSVTFDPPASNPNPRP